MIDFNKSTQYTLSIRLSTDGFSFSVYNPLLDSSIDYQRHWKLETALSFTANLKKAFKEVECVAYNYRRIQVIIDSRRFTFMPQELFQEENASLLFYHNFPKTENELVLHNTLNQYNKVILFGMDRSSYNCLKEQFPEARFFSMASLLFSHFIEKNRLGNHRKLFVHLTPKEMDVFCYDKGQLLLANTFKCQETNDQVYYLLYLFKELGLDQMKDEIKLTDTLTQGKESLVKELRRFVQQVTIIQNPYNEIQILSLCE